MIIMYAALLHPNVIIFTLNNSTSILSFLFIQETSRRSFVYWELKNNDKLVGMNFGVFLNCAKSKWSNIGMGVKDTKKWHVAWCFVF